MRTLLPWPAFILLILLFTSPISAGTWYIKADGSGDAPTIQAGVDNAAAGDTVLVAAGVYSDSVQVSIGGSPAWACVHLYKNITLKAESLLAATIDGSNNEIVIYAENIDSTASIEGFVVQAVYRPYGCFIPAWSPSVDLIPGIGIYGESAAVRITRNEIRNHSFTGIYLVRSAADISDNNVHRCWYGIGLDLSSDAFVHSNRVHGCGGLMSVLNSSPRIVNNQFYADIQGGEIVCTGVYCRDGSVYIAYNDIISIHNSGMYVDDGSVVEHNRFIDHWEALQVEGSNPPPIIRYNLFYNAVQGINQTYAGTPVIEHNTFDKCGVAVTASFLEFSNNIITRSGTGIYCGPGSVVRCNNLYDISGEKYSCGDRTGVDGNISVDPQFCGIPDSENYYLQSDSPCAPGNHPERQDCGQIGAYGVNCLVPVGEFTFGSFKAMFRNSGADTVPGPKTPQR